MPPAQSSDRILLSPPDVGEAEAAAAAEAVRSGWVAPLGPEVDAFEAEFASLLKTDRDTTAALSSGSAGLELALRILGVGEGHSVVVPTSTFVASANAVVQVGATPLFADIAADTWNLDEARLMTHLKEASKEELPDAVMLVDLYGNCTRYRELTEFCRRNGIAVVEDAAEAAGSNDGQESAGLQGDIGVFSFNGNKVMTTSGGGMLVGTPEHAAKARWLASQARSEAYGYLHEERGYNYRLSNVSAAVGRIQLKRLPDMIARRRAIRDSYVSRLSGYGIRFNPANAGSNCWLTVAVLPDHLSPRQLIAFLDDANIEARPAWRPMHLQPLYSKAKYFGGETGEQVFSTSVCLPSGSAMSDCQLDRVVEAIEQFAKRAGG